MKLIKSILTLGATGILMFSCTKDGNGSNQTPPDAATLLSPLDNTECNTGVVVNANATNVTLSWSAVNDADEYQIVLTNLFSGRKESKRVQSTVATFLLDRATPYEWYVISEKRAAPEGTKSEVWRFYNEGVGVENYAPFPANCIAPERGTNLSQNVTDVTLRWNANDVDGDITQYKIIMGVDANTLTLIGETEERFLEDVSVTSGNRYFWKVLTKDEAGNISESEVFDFKVL